MRLSYLEKLASQHLSSDKSLYLADAELAAFVEQLKQRLAVLGHIHISQTPHKRYDHQEVLLDFKVDVTDSLSPRHWDESFDIRRDKNRQLLVYYQNNKLGGFAAIDEIIELLKAHSAQLRRTHAQAAKREAVRQLRVQALIAHVKNAAKTQQFDFRVDYNSQYCALYVRMTEREVLGIRISWKQFQAVLPHLEEAIRKVRELKALGIRFGFMHYAAYRSDWVKWIDL